MNCVKLLVQGLQAVRSANHLGVSVCVCVFTATLLALIASPTLAHFVLVL